MTENLYNADYDIYYTQEELDKYMTKNWDGKFRMRTEKGMQNHHLICYSSFFWSKSRMRDMEEQMIFPKFIKANN